MPELPEVETVVRSLKPKLLGKTIIELRTFDTRFELAERAMLKGASIEEVLRIGKQIVLHLNSDPSGLERWLSFHLAMTGRLTYRPGDLSSAPIIDPHLKSRISLSDGTLDHHDIRRLGRLRFARSKLILEPPGMDPFDPKFSADSVSKLIGISQQEIKVWLLRQDRIRGIGNIYASEILFRAKLSPRALTSSLGRETLERLCEVTMEVLEQAIDCGGSSISTFQDGLGRRGRFQDHLKVYGKEGEPCVDCHDGIRRIIQANRSTFYCPNCQLPGEQASLG